MFQKIDKDQVDLVVPHGVGMKITDNYEANAFNSIFKKKNKPIYSAFKPYVGHNLGGSSLLETVITLLALKKSNNTKNIRFRTKTFESKS